METSTMTIHLRLPKVQDFPDAEVGVGVVPDIGAVALDVEGPCLPHVTFLLAPLQAIELSLRLADAAMAARRMQWNDELN